MKDTEVEKVEKYRLLKDEIAKVWHTRKVMVVLFVIGALGAVSVKFKKYINKLAESKFGSHPENSIAGDSKDSKKKYCPCKTKEKRDLRPLETCCNPLQWTINKAEYPTCVYKDIITKY